MFDDMTASEPKDIDDHARAALETLLSIDPATAPGPALSAALEAAAKLIDRIDGITTIVLPHWETSGDWTNDSSRSPVAWMVNHTGRRRATAGAVRRTALLAASMPHVTAAATTGALPASHLHLLTRARLPEVAEAFDRDEAVLVAAAQTLTADALAAYLTAWRYQALAELERNDPDRAPDHDTDTDTLRVVRGFAGRGILSGDLTPQGLATLTEAIEARIDTWRRTGALEGDARSYHELCAAALLELVADGSTSTRRGHPRPLLIASATLTALFDRADVPANARDAWRAEILGGGPIARAALRRLTEQANIALVITDDDGEPLHVGRARRLATTAMLLALIARSGGHCEVPGCNAHHARCHAHHITHWQHGGATSIDNLVLICPHHHRRVHDGTLTVTRGPTALAFETRTIVPLHPPPYRHAA